MQRLLFPCLLAALLNLRRGASECDLQVVHPTTAQPMTCEIHQSCLSATCSVSISNLLESQQQPLPQAHHSITFELQPCSDPTHLIIAGSLPGGEFRDALVQGLGQVPIDESIDVATQYQLHVPHWKLNSSILQFGMEVSCNSPLTYLIILTFKVENYKGFAGVEDKAVVQGLEGNGWWPNPLNTLLEFTLADQNTRNTPLPMVLAATHFPLVQDYCSAKDNTYLKSSALVDSIPHPLLNTTIRFNRTELCPSSTPSFSTKLPISSPTIAPTRLGETTCEVLQAVSRSQSDFCLLPNPNSCQSMECTLHQVRFTITFLTCGETPAVNIDAYHMLERVTLLHEDFTSSQLTPVDFRGETILFHLKIVLEKSANAIIFMLELQHPLDEARVLFPKTTVPLTCLNDDSSEDDPPETSGRLSISDDVFHVLLVIVVTAAVVFIAFAMFIACYLMYRRRKMRATNFAKTDFYDWSHAKKLASL